MQGVVFPERLLRVIRLRFTLSLFYANLLWTGPLYSQRSLASFGPYTDMSLDYVPSGLTVTTTTMRPAISQVVVLNRDKAEACTYIVGPDASIVMSGTMAIPHTGAFIAAADLDANGTQELIILSADGATVSVVGTSGTNRKERVISLGTVSQRVAIADINNDKRNDILAYGRKRSGISPFLGKSDGSFKTAEILFPEISIGDLHATDLNGDGITDLLLLDWLSNNFSLFYGIGRGIFSEQVVIQLPSEPGDMAITPVTRQRTMRAAVSLPESQEIAIYAGNATGEFESNVVLSCPSSPLQVEFIDVNGDQLPDVVSSTTGGLVVYLAESTTDFRPPTIFGTGGGVSSWSIADVDGDGKKDISFIDASRKRLVVLGNAGGTGSLSASSHYAVGAGPHGFAAQDLNGDGMVDVAVANQGSSSISLLYGRGGMLQGQYTIHTGEGPTYVKVADAAGGIGRTLVTSHSTVDMITVVRHAEDITKTESYTIPTGTQPFVVFAKEDPSTQMLEMLIRHMNPQDGSLTLSLFEQIGGGQFLERSLRPNLPKAIAALTVDAFSDEGTYELVFVTNDRSTKRSTLSIARTTQGFDFKSIQQLLTYEDSSQSTRSIISGNVNDDQFKDIVLLFSAPRNGLGLVYGNQNGAFADSVEVVKGVQPVSDDAVIMKDMDGDGHRDIAMIDELRNAIVVLYGRGGDRFETPVALTPVARNSSFRVMSMSGKKRQDLILSDSSKGTVSIIYDPFRKP